MFDHAAIIKYCDRPFKDIEEMNETLIDNINSMVKENDVLWVVGDFALSVKKRVKELRERITCKHLNLIIGNHDAKNTFRFFDGVYDQKLIKIDRQKIIMNHHCLRTWSGFGPNTFLIFGHSHGNLESEGLSLDVGVDSHNFMPWSFEEIRDYMKGRE